MTVYCVSYDLRKPDRDYNDLYEAIKSYGKWAHAMESTWFIESSKSSSEVADHLKSVMDSDDQSIVIEVDVSQWTSYNLDKEINNWLRQRIPLLRH